MTTELIYLMASAVWCVCLTVPPLLARVRAPGGTAWSWGNRSTALDMEDWGGRATRAHLNMVENLPVFAAVVLTAHVVGVNDQWTTLGAALFFWGRVAHAVVYTAGVTYLRTGVFFVSLGGELLILWRLFAS